MACYICKQCGWDDPQDAIICDMERNEYCLFHAPAELKAGRHEELMNAAWERINCVNEYNIGLPEKKHKTCQLSGSIFDEDADFSDMFFVGEADFGFANFGGKADFGVANFRGKANFYSVIFEEWTDFYSANFGGEAKFISAKFVGEAEFSSAKFWDGASFWYAKFHAWASFRFAKFHVWTSFRSTKAGGEDNKATTDFSYATFDSKGTLEFSQCTITGPFIADKTDFHGRVNFDGSHFKDKVSFITSNLGQVSFNLCKFDQPPIFDRTDLRKAELIGAPVEGFRLMACTWPESRGRKVTYDARKNKGDGYFTIDNIKSVDPFLTPWPSNTPIIPPLKHLEDLYRRLKKVARAEMDEPLASDFHYAEKEMMRLHGLQAFRTRDASDEDTSLISRFQGLGRYLTLSLYRLISGYGEAPLRALWTLCMLLYTPYMLLEPTNTIVGVWIVGMTFLFTGTWRIVPLLLGFLLLDMNIGVLGLNTLPTNRTVGLTTLAKWINFLPLTKLDNSIPAVPRIIMLAWQVAITLQAALFGFALRNRFRR